MGRRVRQGLLVLPDHKARKAKPDYKDHRGRQDRQGRTAPAST